MFGRSKIADMRAVISLPGFLSTVQILCCVSYRFKVTSVSQLAPCGKIARLIARGSFETKMLHATVRFSEDSLTLKRGAVETLHRFLPFKHCLMIY